MCLLVSATGLAQNIDTVGTKVRVFGGLSLGYNLYSTTYYQGHSEPRITPLSARLMVGWKKLALGATYTAQGIQGQLVIGPGLEADWIFKRTASLDIGLNIGAGIRHYTSRSLGDPYASLVSSGMYLTFGKSRGIRGRVEPVYQHVFRIDHEPVDMVAMLFGMELGPSSRPKVPRQREWNDKGIHDSDMAEQDSSSRAVLGISVSLSTFAWPWGYGRDEFARAPSYLNGYAFPTSSGRGMFSIGLTLKIQDTHFHEAQFSLRDQGAEQGPSQNWTSWSNEMLFARYRYFRSLRPVSRHWFNFLPGAYVQFFDRKVQLRHGWNDPTTVITNTSECHGILVGVAPRIFMTGKWGGFTVTPHLNLAAYSVGKTVHAYSSEPYGGSPVSDYGSSDFSDLSTVFEPGFSAILFSDLEIGLVLWMKGAHRQTRTP